MTPSPPTSTTAAAFAAIPLNAVPLSAAQIQQAWAWSQVAWLDRQQWQLYLQGLALLGFQQWLGDRAPDLTVESQSCSLLHPIYANLLTGICQLRAGDVQLCLQVMGSLTEPQVAVSRAALELTEWAPHGFVLVEVQEEQGWVSILGGLHRDRLLANQTAIPLSPQPNWTYELPRTWFDTSPEDVLLWLQCLQPAPATPILPGAELAPVTLGAAVMERVPQLQARTQDGWQVLTWEQAAALATQPDLANELAQALDRQALDRQALAESEQAPESPSVPPVMSAPQRINVGQWIQGQLEDWAEAMGWILLPPLAMDWRSNGTEASLMVQALQHQGLEIPPTTGAAYQDLTVGRCQLRLYSLAWPLPVTDAAIESSAWTLLLVLGPPPGGPLGVAIQLQVRDAAGFLDEQILRPNDSQAYRYIQVVGTLEEQFWVILAPVEGPPDAALELPPFCFDLESSR